MVFVPYVVKHLLIVFLFSLPTAAASGTPLSHIPTSFLNTTPTVLEEVSGTTFTNVVLRPDRDVWAASLDTIVRYDGHGVTSYRLPGISSAGLPVARVAELFVDSAQRIWAAGFDGRVFNFNPDIERFQLAVSIDLHAARVVEAKHDGGTGLWFGFSDGSCFVYDIERQTTQQRCQGLEGATVDFAFGSASTLALSEGGTILNLKPNPNPTAGPENTEDNCSLPGTTFTEISALTRDTVLLGTHGAGLFKCSTQDGGDKLRAAESVDAVSRKTTVHEILVAESTGKVFVATDSGLDVLDAESLKLLYSSKFASDLVNTEFTALALQGTDTIWASSFAGLYRLHASATVITKDLPGNPTPSIIGFTSLGDHVIIADYAGLFLSDQKGLGRNIGSAIHHMCDISGGITAVTTWENHVVYGLRSGGVFRLPFEAGQAHCGASSLISDIGPISTLIPANDSLLIGTFGKGAYRFNAKTGLQKIEASTRSDPD